MVPAASMISAATQAMLSGPPAELARLISSCTAAAGSPASRRTRWMPLAGTTVVSPSEQSR